MFTDLIPAIPKGRAKPPEGGDQRVILISLGQNRLKAVKPISKFL